MRNLKQIFRNYHGFTSIITAPFLIISSFTGTLYIYSELFKLQPSYLLMLFHHGDISRETDWLSIIYSLFLFTLYTSLIFSGVTMYI
jgi:hypothetical protein